MDKFLKRTWAEINLDSIKSNLQVVQSKLNTTDVMAVVKADAYGHGDRAIVECLAQNGVKMFAVSNIEEAISLRQASIKGEILVLGYTPSDRVGSLSDNDITQTVYSVEYADELQQQCVQQNVTIKTHIKLDTGMGRIGVTVYDLSTAIKNTRHIYEQTNLDCKGIFTHLSTADSQQSQAVEYAQKQLEHFNQVITHLKTADELFEQIHVQNSAGILAYGDMGYSCARAGIILYGINPSGERVSGEIVSAMELKSVVSMVKMLPKGESISYGQSYVANHDMKIATVPIGYADGYSRLLSNKGEMLINGEKAMIVGNVCMDQLMVDVTHIEDVKMGDLVTLVGRDGDRVITFEQVASQIGTIGYELICLIGRRVPRVYIKDGKRVEVVDYINR